MRAPRLLALASLLAARVASGADCNGNGTPDIEEVRSGALPDCNGNGVPDACDIARVNYGMIATGSFLIGGRLPFAMAVDDLDANGDVDVAAPGPEGEDVTVLWNDGRGGFASPAQWPAGQPAGVLIPADLNLDGLKDLMVGGQLGLTILVHGANRRFSARAPQALDPETHILTAGNLDGDSDIDLVTRLPFGVRVFRNEGDGLFVGLDAIALGSNPTAIVAAMLDGDDDLDLATSNSPDAGVPGNVSVLLNRGDGSFEPARNYGRGPGTRNGTSLVSGDLDGDGDADLATCSFYGEEITILLGDGQGRFEESRQLGADVFLLDLTAADLDGDGNLDLAASGAENESPAGVSVFLNQGGDRFSPPVELETGFQPLFMLSADLDGDRSMDLVVSESNSQSFTVLERSEVAYTTDCNSNARPDDCELEGNDCNGNELPDACDIASLESADCDRNGTPDECQPDCNRNRIADACDIASGLASDCNRNGSPDDCDVRWNGPEFDLSFLSMTSFMDLLSSSDLDSDGREDIFALRASVEPQDFLVFWNAAPAGFLPAVSFPAGRRISDGANGDLDGDTDEDIVMAEAFGVGLRILENRGNRSFGEGRSLPVRIGAQMVSTADLDGDQDLDIAATTVGGVLVVFEDPGDGAFGEPLRVGAPVSGTMLEVADLDGDGRMDLVSDGVQQDSIHIFWNNGMLAFEGPTLLEPGSLVESVAITDADGDGDMDLLLSADRLMLFRNSGGRAFALETLDNVQGRASGILPADLDGDGDQDLVLLFPSFTLAAAMNRGGGAFGSPQEIAPFGVEVSIPTGGDWNGDGAMDMAIIRHLHLIILQNASRNVVSPDADTNGVPDECQQRPFHRGDADGDGLVNLTDAVFTLGHLFRGEPAPACLEAADTDNDARLEITDPIATLDFLFRSGPPPALPGPSPADCGLDTDASGSAGDIGCGAYTGC